MKAPKETVTSKETFYDRLVAEGYPVADIYHHESDMYIFVTPKTKALVRRSLDDGVLLVRPAIFRDQVTGRPMYDLAFQYLPWWCEKVRDE